MLEEEEAKEARNQYVQGYNETVTLGEQIKALKEVRAFVDCHTESWYLTGQRLLGKIDAVIHRLETDY